MFDPKGLLHNVNPHETKKILSLPGATEQTRPYEIAIEAESAVYNWLSSPQVRLNIRGSGPRISPFPGLPPRRGPRSWPAMPSLLADETSGRGSINQLTPADRPDRVFLST